MQDKVKKILAQQLGLDAAEITDDKSFVDDFDMDSLDMVEMTVELEQETGLSLKTEDLSEVKTVGQLMELLEKLQ